MSSRGALDGARAEVRRLEGRHAFGMTTDAEVSSARRRVLRFSLAVQAEERRKRVEAECLDLATSHGMPREIMIEIPGRMSDPRPVRRGDFTEMGLYPLGGEDR